MKTSIMIFLIISVGILIYSNSLGNDFIWDDTGFIIKNDYIKDLRLYQTYFISKEPLAQGGLSEENYRPFLPLSLAIDYYFWKLNPLGYHLTNLLFHILNALALFGLIYIITRSRYIAFLASIFFLTHPIQTESVCWISGRADVLFLFFYIISFALYILYVQRKNLIFYLASLPIFLCAILSKEMAASLPLALILYDIFYAKKEKLSAKILRYFPYFLILELYILLRFAVIGKLAQCTYWGDSFYRTFLTMARGLVEYIRLLLFPVNLCADYLRYPVSSSIREPGVILSLSIIIFIVFFVILIAKKMRHISFSVFFFFVTLAPALNIIPIKIIIAERFLYLPSIGYCFCIAILIVYLADRLRRSKMLRALCFLFAGVLVCVYSHLTMARNLEWADEIQFWKRNVAIYPDNERAHYNLAVAFISRENELEKAFEEAKKAIELAPNYSYPRTITASYYIQNGKLDEAIEELKYAIKIDPDFLHAYTFLGGLYAFRGDYDAAYKEYAKALARNRDFLEASVSIAALYEMKDETNRSIKEYEKIVQAKPVSHYRSHYAAAYLRLGDLYASVGEKEKAMEAWDKVSNDFKDQIWFSEIASYLTGNKSLEELLYDTDIWQPEFKIVAYYHVAFKNEIDGDIDGARTYYLRASSIVTKAPNQVKQLAVRRLMELDEKIKP